MISVELEQQYENEKMIVNYFENQLQEDCAKNQISLEEFADSFMGEQKSKEKQAATSCGCL